MRRKDGRREIIKRFGKRKVLNLYPSGSSRCHTRFSIELIDWGASNVFAPKAIPAQA